MANDNKKAPVEEPEATNTAGENAENTAAASDNSAETQEDLTDGQQAEADPVEALNAKLKEVNDKYLRLYSDFENFRKRTSKEKLELIKNGSADVVKNLLPVLDDFERAIASNESSEDLASIKEGVKLVHHKFHQTLSQQGLKEIEAQGKEFDLDHHEAVTKIPADKDMKGKVVDVLEKGYFLNDKVIRYAKVVIGE